jgi:hypothetical protein
VPRGDVLDCKTERAGERMAEPPRRSIRKLDFYCADSRGRVAFPSLDLFNLPRFTAAAFFWTRDCVGELLLSGVTRSCPRCCVALGKNTLEALTRNPPRGGRAKPIAPAARPAPQHHHLARDAEHLGHLPDSEVVELTWFHSARSTLWKTRARIRLPAFAENDGIERLREDTNSLKLKRGCLVQTGGLSPFHRVILARALLRSCLLR